MCPADRAPLIFGVAWLLVPVCCACVCGGNSKPSLIASAQPSISAWMTSLPYVCLCGAHECIAPHGDATPCSSTTTRQ